jgi:hypothetical protein
LGWVSGLCDVEEKWKGMGNRRCTPIHADFEEKNQIISVFICVHLWLKKNPARRGKKHSTMGHRLASLGYIQSELVNPFYAPVIR